MMLTREMMIPIDFNTVDVRLFKQFTICYKDKTMIPREAMPLRRSALLALLIIRRDSVCSVSDLSEIYCPHSKKPEGALRNLIYRIRQALADIWPDEAFILARPNGYQWNPEISVQIDTQTFDVLYNQFRLSKEIDAQINLGLELVDLYAGDFDKLAKSRFEWIRQRSVYFQICMTDMLKVLADDLAACQRSAELKSIALSIISKEYIDETLHQSIIRALLSCSLYFQATSYCQWLINFFRHTLEIEPSSATFKLQSEAVVAETLGSDQTHSLEAIAADLDAATSKNKALYCEYDVFKKIYTAVSNQFQLHTTFFYLTLITLDPQARFKKGMSLHSAATTVKVSLSQVLHADSVYTQCAFNQFLIFFPASCQGDAEKTAKCLSGHLELQLGKAAYTLEMQPISRCNPLPPPHAFINNARSGIKISLRSFYLFDFYLVFSIFLRNVIFL
jgi:DNA-binding SARP family transcriptional activator